MINLPDLINSLFEFGGIFFIFGHIRAVMKDKFVAGVYVPAHVFFSLWGYWNIFYYWNLSQWASLLAGTMLALINTYYTYLLFKYSKNKEK